MPLLQVQVRGVGDPLQAGQRWPAVVDALLMLLLLLVQVRA